MNKEIVIKESARTKGKRQCAAALKVATSENSKTTSTKAGIFIKRLAKQIILF